MSASYKVGVQFLIPSDQWFENHCCRCGFLKCNAKIARFAWILVEADHLGLGKLLQPLSDHDDGMFAEADAGANAVVALRRSSVGRFCGTLGHHQDIKIDGVLLGAIDVQQQIFPSHTHTHKQTRFHESFALCDFEVVTEGPVQLNYG